MKRIGKLLAFGNGGHSIEFGGGCRLSGYDRPETFDGWDDAPDGCPVLDKRPAIDTDAGYRHVFQGPMVNVDLADDQVDECPKLDGNLMVTAMVGAGSEYGTLAVLQMAHGSKPAGPDPLDSVSTSVYMDGWVKLGARRGVVQNRQIIWSE
jgi:hypothetical protein